MPPFSQPPRPPMPGQAPGMAPRPPMPGMSSQAPGMAPRPPMPGMPGVNAQGGFGAPRPQGPQAGFGSAPRPAASGVNAQGGFGAPRTQGPQGGFGAPQPQGGFGAVQQQSEMNFGDNQYIKDLKTLEQFYEDNKYTEILAQRYEDFKIPG